VPGARTEGQILIDGQDIHAEDVIVTDLRRRVGMVFEEPVPLPMSIFDNIAYGPRMRGIRNKAVLAERVEESLKLAVLWDEVKDRLHTSALRLSGGQQQRLCIARILSLGPEIMLLDRPCAALDPISTAKIEDSLVLLKEKVTIVLIPHNTQQAVRVADRAGFMLMGKWSSKVRLSGSSPSLRTTGPATTSPAGLADPSVFVPKGYKYAWKIKIAPDRI
jgi:phosphate transport system ATP-binding protein